MVSFNVVSLMAMVPDRECNTPTLIVSSALTVPEATVNNAIAPTILNLRNFSEILFMEVILKYQRS